MTRYPSLAASARLAAADARPGSAIVEGSLAWTWQELDVRAEAIARELLLAGVRPGSRVAMLTVPSAAMVATLHAIARVGGVAAPLGPGLMPNELAVAGEVIAAHLVIHDPSLEGSARALGGPLRSLDDLTGTSLRSDTRGALGVLPPPLPSPDPAEPAVIVLTSGTTGRPKAVVLSTAALAASAEAWLAALPEATGWLLAVGLAHVAGLGVVWRAALSGVPLVVLARPDPVAILAALGAAPHPSHVSLVQTVLTRLLDLGGDVRPPPTLRAVPLGGGAIAPALVRRAIAAGWPVVPTYGLSEAGSGVTASPTDEAAIHPDTAGRPLPGVALRIVEPDAEGIGGIQVAGPALFSEYLGDPLATAAAWSDDGWLETGDLGRLDADGRLVVADRRTDRIVRGGENMSPTEVEAVLLDHPAIADAVVVARADPVYGQVPVAAILLRQGHADPGDEALETLCRERLARFKVPVAFVRLDAIPRTAAGKPRRAELRVTLDPTPRIEQESSA